jgi:hypothetical protein
MFLYSKKKIDFSHNITNAEKFYITQILLADLGRYSYLLNDPPDDISKNLN